MSRAHRRATVPLLSVLVCCLHAGCLLPYGYPRYAQVPGVEMKQEANEVHAFRVDARVHTADLAVDVEEYRLGRVPLTADGRVPSTARLDFDYGCYIVGVAANYPVSYTHQTGMRLYRPGWQVVELGQAENTGKIDWQPAASLAQQEKAVDDLLAVPRVNRLSLSAKERPARPWSLKWMAPGSSSPVERDALRFAADEYERLAAAAAGDAKAAQRLKAKAKEARDHAAR